MQKGKIIVLEGTDCSGKTTQLIKLMENLSINKIAYKVFKFPNYNSATGKIIGGAYLGKDHIGQPLFKEGAANVPAKVASLLYAADRLYNIKPVLDAINDGFMVILDRYVDSNFAHQASKLHSEKEQDEMFEFLEKLEYGLLQLPKPDITVFLYMPVSYSKQLKSMREEEPDQHESDENYLNNAEKVYLKLAKLHNYIKIDCVVNEKIKSVNELSKEIFDVIKLKLQ